MTNNFSSTSMKSGTKILFHIVMVTATIIAGIGCVSCRADKAVHEEGPGVWKLTFGKADHVTLLSELDCEPRWQSIKGLGEAPQLPFGLDEIHIEEVEGKTHVRFPLEVDEQIYGLGLNFKSVNRRGSTMRLHVDHYGVKDNGRTHAPVPFFVSSRGYGVLINSARYIDVWCGTGVRRDSPHQPEIRDRNTDPKWTASPLSDNIEFLIPASGIEIILFSGNTMLEVVQRYNLYCGGGCLPPKWGLGFWQRVPSLSTDKDIENEVSDFATHGFPLSVIGLEPGWMSSSYPCSYEWDITRFPKPATFISDLMNKGIRTNVWINPYVSPLCELSNRLVPYCGSHTVWCGLVPDYSLEKTRKTISDYFASNHLDCGVSGYKMDENDGYDQWLWPDIATFPSGHSAEQIRQIYGSLMQKTTTDLFRSRNQRTYGLVRAANAGTNSMPYVIYNDYYNHRDFITALINSSFIGVLWTPEVRSSKTAEEWLRRMQTVCFSPLAMLNAWSDGTKPWTFTEVQKPVLEVAMLRMQLMPYLYTAFADYAMKGIPPFRAMYLEPGLLSSNREQKGTLDGTENPYEISKRIEIKDQWMVGPSLLVAPLFEGQSDREVLLPEGRWYDFYTGDYVGSGEIIKTHPTDYRIPLYVKDGGIIPMLPPIENFDYSIGYPVEVRYYGTSSAEYQLYDDDGISFDYEQGDYVWIVLRVENSHGAIRGTAVLPKNVKPWSYDSFHFKFMTRH